MIELVLVWAALIGSSLYLALVKDVDDETLLFTSIISICTGILGAMYVS